MIYDYITTKPPLNNETLAHYGVKGMKWRRRKAKKMSQDQKLKYYASKMADDISDGRRNFDVTSGDLVKSIYKNRTGSNVVLINDGKRVATMTDKMGHKFSSKKSYEKQKEDARVNLDTKYADANELLKRLGDNQAKERVIKNKNKKKK